MTDSYTQQQIPPQGLKLAFDAKRAFLNASGLGNYSRTLLKNLLQYQQQNEYYFYTPKTRNEPQTEFLLQPRPNVHIEVPPTAISQRFAALWRVFMPKKRFRKNQLNIFHGLSNELPLNMRKLGVKSVVTIHDLIFMRYPQWYKSVDRKIYHYKTIRACKDADLVIAISEQTKHDLMQFLHVPEKKIQVVYQSCDDVYLQTASDTQKAGVKQKYNLPAQYLLYVGTIEPRKNLLSICQALRLLKDKVKLPLVCIGKPAPYKEKVVAFLRAYEIQDRVLFLEKIPLADMPAIYQQAEAFIYPSTFEGFGIPIIEALYSKVPVITSTGSCFSEAGGPDSIYADPGNILQLAAAIEDLVQHPEKVQQMKQNGWKYAQQFNGENTSRQLMEAYRNLINKGSA